MPRLRHPAVRTLVTVLLSFCASILAAQEVQIRRQVELVVVPVTVKSPNGTPAASLTKEAFTVKEAGKAQTITSFSVDPVPLSAAIVIDTGISETAFTRLKTSVPSMLGAFAEDDEVAVYRFEKSVERLTEFTTDHARVSNVLGNLSRGTPSTSTMTSGPFSAPGPVINGVPIIPGVQSAGRTIAAPTKVLHDAVFQAAEDLGARDIERRRIVILISDGQNRNSLHSYDTALERLLTQQVQVFSIGVDTTVFQRMRSPLGSYAKDTGSESWFPDSQADIESCYSLSTESARNQYVLGYVSSNKRPATKPVFREIKVQVSLKNAEIRHKRGYYQAP
jgi:VWFA-related protein